MIKKINKPRALFYLILFLVASLFVGGCQRQSTGSQLSATVIDRAVRTMKSVRSYHFTVESQAISEKGSRAISMDGDWLKPNKMRFTLTAPKLTQEVILIGQKAYLKNQTAGKWQARQSVPTESSPLESITMIAKYKSVKRLSDQTADGLSVYHIQANYDPDVFIGKSIGFNAYTKSALTGATATADYLIDKKTGYLRQMVLKLQNIAVAGGRFNLTIKAAFNDFNQPVEIGAPI